MIPYIQIPPLTIWGPIVIQPFSFLVLTGCVVGFFAARWHARTRGLALDHLEVLSVCVLVPGFVVSHLISLVPHMTEVVIRDPMILIKIGGSLSSFGGFLGGTIGAIFYLKRYNLPMLDYEDAIVFGLTIGWFFGRLGCAIVHDHPGVHSDFFLAIQFPGGSRHDLGFYEWLFTICLIGVLCFIRSRELPPGIIVGIVCVLYSPVRFMLDFLRVGEKLFWGLTIGQHFAALLLPTGIVVLVQSVKKRGQIRC